SSVLAKKEDQHALSGEMKKVGIIGLDTSHSVAFTKALNGVNPPEAYKGYKVVSAYKFGSNDIVSSYERIPAYTEEVKKYGVEIVDSIAELLEKVDFVLLETNDGRLHLEQALQVLEARKPMFIDKPMAASLKDVMAIFEAADKYQVPLFSASSLRYLPSVQDVVSGKIGKVLGADAFSPLKIEKTHPDLFWYGIHGVETLLTVMGTGCQQVTRYISDDNETVVGVWDDGRIGSFRGIKNGKTEYGGTVFGSEDVLNLGSHVGYHDLLIKIIDFFESGIPPVSKEETLEIFAFMEAADVSKEKDGATVHLKSVY
ncbi:MAG: hypothetical protein ACI9IP_003067, partial [Arcticibacterium sp.]